ncbi:MAG: hypothetical protein CML99_13175 [Rhodobiaceae bacterium]|nr:hypothetical protein [Rhodobiaceae bacterium]
MPNHTQITPEDRPHSANARALIADAENLLTHFYATCERRCTPLALNFLAQSTGELLTRYLALTDAIEDLEESEHRWLSFWLAALAAHLRILSDALRDAGDEQ